MECLLTVFHLTEPLDFHHMDLQDFPLKEMDKELEPKKTLFLEERNKDLQLPEPF